jgi:hypothetical protein
MSSRNDITGDKIQTKGILSKEGENNWDKIFGKKEPIKLTQHEVNSIETIEALIEIHDAKRRSRIDTVGQNGNDGLHYEYELDKSTGEVVKVDSKKLTEAFNGH